MNATSNQYKAQHIYIIQKQKANDLEEILLGNTCTLNLAKTLRETNNKILH